VPAFASESGIGTATLPALELGSSSCRILFLLSYSRASQVMRIWKRHWRQSRPKCWRERAYLCVLLTPVVHLSVKKAQVAGVSSAVSFFSAPAVDGLCAMLQLPSRRGRPHRQLPARRKMQMPDR
jgi:hypothetical protein